MAAQESAHVLRPSWPAAVRPAKARGVLSDAEGMPFPEQLEGIVPGLVMDIDVSSEIGSGGSLSPPGIGEPVPWGGHEDEFTGFRVLDAPGGLLVAVEDALDARAGAEKLQDFPGGGGMAEDVSDLVVHHGEGPGLSVIQVFHAAHDIRDEDAPFPQEAIGEDGPGNSFDAVFAGDDEGVVVSRGDIEQLAQARIHLAEVACDGRAGGSLSLL